jgi:hypothetical protein
MKRDKDMGMDVHQATTVVAVIDAEGKALNDGMICHTAPRLPRLFLPQLMAVGSRSFFPGKAADQLPGK